MELNKTEQVNTKKNIIANVIGLGARTFGFNKNKVKQSPLFYLTLEMSVENVIEEKIEYKNIAP